MTKPTPLFQDRKDLLTEIRLGGLGGGTVADQIVDSAIAQAAVHIRLRLGKTRLAELVAIQPPVDGVPSTDDHYDLLLAQGVEVDIVRWLLFGKLESAFKEARGQLVTSTNTEGGVRDMSRREVGEERRRLWDDPDNGIAVRLAILKGDTITTLSLSGQSFTIGTEEGDQVILRALFPGNELATY